MKEYIASCTLNGTITIVKMEYNTKKEFANELRANGYRVRFISTEEKFDEDAEKYNERCEDHNKARRIAATLNRR